MIIAIDGPAGAGKSTIATLVALRMGYQLIDTGAIYRTVAWTALNDDISVEDGDACADIARALSFEFEFKEAVNRIVCNGRVLGQEIRTQQIGEAASKVSAHKAVRDALLDVQRQLGQRTHSVLEGRDIGTVVFPEAECKIFLTASAEERAQRRHDQLLEKVESDVNYEAILDEIKARDERDSTREHAPLKQADDAISVDTTGRDIKAIVDEIIRHVERAIMLT